MSRFVITLMALFMLLIAGCASNGTMNSTEAIDNSGLPEIASYDDEPFEPLPDMVPADTIPADVTVIETAPADVAPADTVNAGITDDNTLPEIPTTEDAPVEPLPEFVPAQ